VDFAAGALSAAPFRQDSNQQKERPLLALLLFFININYNNDVVFLL